MTKNFAIECAVDHFDSGAFLQDLQRRIALRTESQKPEAADILTGYLQKELIPALIKLGFTSHAVHPNPAAPTCPFLVAARYESEQLPTVLLYGHGDVVNGYDEQWRTGLSPWKIAVEGDRWYGRGTADNKGQHSINLAALAAVIKARDSKLGFNIKLLLETGEEIGSPGLHAFCARQKTALSADLLIASDGPRLSAANPTIFLGSRGLINFKLSLDLRAGAHHSGNWGGVLRNPGVVLAAAISSMVNAKGKILLDGLRPPALDDAVRRALSGVQVGGNPGEPNVDEDYGEPGLTPAERLFGWNTLEVLAFKTGNPDKPVSAIPSRASAQLQLRFVVGTAWQELHKVIRQHLDDAGFPFVSLEVEEGRPATRLAPDDAWVGWAMKSIESSVGKKPVLLPNLGGTCPNDAFETIIGMPTLWVPHSYPGCSQHAPDEHMLASVTREALQIMAGLFWDLGGNGRLVHEEKKKLATNIESALG